MKLTNIALAALALFSLNYPGRAAAVEMKLPVPEIETLPNGMQIVWFLNDSLPVVDLALLVKSGFRDDPVGKSGTAELLSASLDRGAGGMTAQQIARSVEMLGASRYSAAEDDTFSVGMHGLAPDAPALLGLLSRIVIHPDFPEADVAREHARILDRWTHIGDSGDSLANVAYSRLISAGTPYGRGNFVSVKEFNKVSRKDVIKYHTDHFTPDSAVLMVVGRANKKEFKAQIEKEFGAWAGKAVPRATKAKYADNRLKVGKGEVLEVERSGLTQAQVRIGFHAPLIKAPEHYSLSVANALLGEYFNSRLMSVIRDKLGLTYSIGSSFSYSKDAAHFTISSATRNETVGQLIKKTVDILKDLKRGPIPAAEVQMAKEYLVGGYPLGVATLGAVASRWLNGYVFDMGPDYLNEFVPKVTAISQDDVLRAVMKDFDLDHLVIVVAGDQEIRKSLTEAKIKTKRVSARDLM